MTHLTFIDTDGIEWQVWDVHRVARERRGSSRRRNGNQRPARDRRIIQDRRVPVSQGHELGWLAFASASEKRRLSPVPDRWPEMSSEELRRLLGQALRVANPRRLIE